MQARDRVPVSAVAHRQHRSAGPTRPIHSHVDVHNPGPLRPHPGPAGARQRLTTRRIRGGFSSS